MKSCKSKGLAMYTMNQDDSVTGKRGAVKQVYFEIDIV
jgi:hypothetical protein